MKIAFLVAVDEKGGIGKSQGIPWYLPADLQHFKQLTMGHHILMGRKTWETIGRPLPGRISLVLTRQEGYQAPGAIEFRDLESAISYAKNSRETELFVIGGGQIFSQLLPRADAIYLTRVYTDSQADVFFPPLDPNEWELVDSQSFSPDERNAVPFAFQTLKRKIPNVWMT